MREKLVTCVSCQDGEYLWCYDEIICALSQINMSTLQVECVISPMQILKNESYKIRKLIVWKDSIIILPVQINKKWVIYDKIRKRIEYAIFCLEDYSSSEAILIGDKLIFLPICVENPIIVVDLLKRKVIRKISLQQDGFIAKSEMKIWDGKIDQNDICFFVRESFFYGRLNRNSLKLIKLNTTRPLLCADFDEGYIWAIDNNGNFLHQFDREGNLLKDFLIDTGTRFTRILVENQNIFFIPETGDVILKFNIAKEKLQKIGEDAKNISFSYPEIAEMKTLPVYWDYIKTNSDIWFLPLKSQLKKVNLDTLLCKQQTIEYTNDFSRTTYKKYLEYVRIIKKRFIFYENSTSINCEEYLEMLNKSDWINEKKSKKNIFAEEIWKALV